jgi:hypothetical protein
MTMRPLPQPATTAECYLAAVVDRLDQLTAAVTELNGRLGSSSQPPTGHDEEGMSVRLREPDTGPAAAVRLREPDVPEPPRHGKGSSRDAWALHADQIGVPYPPNAGQRDIIAAVDAAKRAA